MKKSILIVALVIVFVCSIALSAFALDYVSWESKTIKRVRFIGGTACDFSYMDDGNYRYYYRNTPTDLAYTQLYITYDSLSDVFIQEGETIDFNLKFSFYNTASGITSCDDPWDMYGAYDDGVHFTLRFIMQNEGSSFMFAPEDYIIGDIYTTVGGYGGWGTHGSFTAPCDCDGQFAIQLTFDNPIEHPSEYPTTVIKTSLACGFTYNGYIADGTGGSSGSTGGNTYISYDVDLTPIIEYLEGTLTNFENVQSSALTSLVNYLYGSNLKLVYSELQDLYELHNEKFDTFEGFLASLYEEVSTFLPSIDSNLYEAVEVLNQIKEILEGANLDTSGLESVTEDLQSNSKYLGDAQKHYNDEASTYLDSIEFPSLDIGGLAANQSIMSWFDQFWEMLPDSMRYSIILSVSCGLVLVILGCGTSLVRRR